MVSRRGNFHPWARAVASFSTNRIFPYVASLLSRQKIKPETFFLYIDIFSYISSLWFSVLSVIRVNFFTNKFTENISIITSIFYLNENWLFREISFCHSITEFVCDNTIKKIHSLDNLLLSSALFSHYFIKFILEILILSWINNLKSKWVILYRSNWFLIGVIVYIEMKNSIIDYIQETLIHIGVIDFILDWWISYWVD